MDQASENGSGKGNSCLLKAEETLKGLKGIVKFDRLNDSDKQNIWELEEKAGESVLMGMCKGINVGVMQALEKKNVFACLTNDLLIWPKESYMKLVCGDDVIGEDKYDPDELEQLKKNGELVAGNLVMYREKMKIYKERRAEARLHLLPMRIPELTGCGAVVASPSPPADSYMKGKLKADMNDPKLGTIIVGVD